MGKTFLKEAARLLQAKRQKSRWTRTVISLSLVVALVTSSLLSHPAITMERAAACGMSEHTHNGACYQQSLICGKEEQPAVEAKEEKVLICQLSEHEHAPECQDADGNLICTQEAHKHGDGCYQINQIPGVEGHKHTGTCYQDTLVCQTAEHKHSETCYPVQTEATPSETVPETSAPSTEAQTAAPATEAQTSAPATEAQTTAPETEKATEKAKKESKKEKKETEEVWEAQTLTNKGTDYTITVEASAAAKIPQDAVLKVRELKNDTTPQDYTNYSQQAEAKVQQQLGKEILYGRYFDLTIEADGKEIQPSVPVTVKVTYTKTVEHPQGSEIKVVFFGDQTEILNVTRTNLNNQVWSEAEAEVKSMTVLVFAGIGIKETEAPATEISTELETETAIQTEEITEKATEAESEIETEVGTEETTELTSELESDTETVTEEATELTSEVESESETEVSTEETTEVTSEVESESETEIETEIAPLTLTAEGSDYTIEVSYTAEAEIPEGEQLSVREIASGTEEYDNYYQQALAAVQEGDTTTLSFARFFDISFVLDGAEIEPKAPVSVKVSYTNAVEVPEESDIKSVHFGDTAEVLEVQTNAADGEMNEVTFEAERSSVYAIIVVTKVAENKNILTAETDRYKVTVTYGDDAMLPENVTLRVTELEENSQEYQEAKNAVVEEKKTANENFDESSMGMAALDISILDEAGNEVEPAEGAKVDVKIEINQLPEEVDAELLKNSMEIQHIKDHEAITVADTGVKTEGEVEVSEETAAADFSVDHFSTFTVTWSEKLETMVLTADGASYKITIEYDSDAGIPDGSELKVNEVTGSAKTRYVSELNNLVYGELSEKSVSFSRFFDISILYEGKEIEPKKAVKVTITADGTDVITGDVNIIHYAEDGTEMIPADRQEDHSIVYEQESFSVVGFFEAKPTEYGTIRLASDTAASSAEAPAHSKTIKDNGDGTYDITLSVTGKTSSSTVTDKADVIIVFDTSRSMEYPVGSTSSTGRYGYYNNEYVKLYTQYTDRNGDKQYTEIASDNVSGDVYYNVKGYWLYKGPRYTTKNYSSSSRLTVAKNAVKELGEQLLANNTSDEEYVTLSLITFDNTATPILDKTTDLARFQVSVEAIEKNLHGATNWEAALDEAANIQTNSGATKYVIFVSDGNPTKHNTGGNTLETDTNVATCYSHAIPKVGQFGENFYGVGVFGNVTRMQDLVAAAGADNSHYQSATDQASLNAAFANIITSITRSATFKKITMTDNLTDLTSTDLVNGTASNFKYKKAGKTWSDAPAATYDKTSKKITWDLKDTVVQDGVTYSVSFTVWPSQEAYDLVAKLKNGTISYAELSEAQKYQIVANQDGTYKLRTNTSTGNEVTYTKVNTVTTNGSQTTTETNGKSDFVNPDPIPLDDYSIQIKKEWNDSIDKANRAQSVQFYVGYDENNDNVVNANDSNAVLVTLSQSNNWSSSVYVAPGLMTEANGKKLEPGHDYSANEITSNTSYELTVNSIHPMLIGKEKVVKNLVENEEVNPNITITATNNLRGRIELRKVVMDTDGKADISSSQTGSTFTITASLKTVDGKSLSGVSYKVLQDADCDGNADTPENILKTVTLSDGGKIEIKTNQIVRFVDLPNGAICSFTEETETIPNQYEYVSVTGNGTVAYNTTNTVQVTNKLKPVDITLKKVDENDNSPLTGAEFTLMKLNSASNKCENVNGKENIVVNQTDGVKLEKLETGSYKLVETKAPDGYIINSKAIEFQITADSNGNITITGLDSQPASYDSVNNVLTVTNRPGVALPNTGGSGTLPYTLSGLMVLLSAMMYGFVLRRRRERGLIG